ncbi:class I SAM-dependent methyltransferase [Thermoflexibacter ruber]|uniref:Methyltransferase domain-containing protein n=1 Tax=Thermoflexibacter ruber TaxID=1003 RepID=A0A1I2DVT1_9BACT|nr:class I SAM-dependent methyltransferase [Thermoflexibacter ruber]SFE84782.1 Methyltransferase domain-containing protein [Thermoflexibacter ruber]
MKQKRDTFRDFISQFLIKHQEWFRNKVVLDCPAGEGITAACLQGLGAKVIAYDLFPEYFKVEGITCQMVDVMKGIPLADESVDVIVCQEGIEHFSDQLKVMKEFSRVLKKGGRLLITTPNYSNLRAKLSYLLSESERFNDLMPPNELDSIWLNNQSVNKEIYYGHIFLIGVQKLHVLGRIAGFKIQQVVFEKAKPTSLLLFPFLYPFIFLSNCFTYVKNMLGNKQFDLKVKKEVYGKAFRLSINPKILVDGSLFIVFEKEATIEEMRLKLERQKFPIKP